MFFWTLVRNLWVFLLVFVSLGCSGSNKGFQESGNYELFNSDICVCKDYELIRTLKAMSIVAEGEGGLDRIASKFHFDPSNLASLILEKSKQYKIDPELLVVMAWKESRFNAQATNGYKERPKEGLNCGLLQVRTDINNRPTCEQMKNPVKNLEWACRELSRIRTSNNGILKLSQYNGKRYEVQVWREYYKLKERLWEED